MSNLKSAKKIIEATDMSPASKEKALKYINDAIKAESMSRTAAEDNIEEALNATNRALGQTNHRARETCRTN